MQVTSGSQRAPNNWSNYLADRNNKQELPEFLFSQWSSDEDKQYSPISKDTKTFVSHGTQCHALKVRTSCSFYGNPTTSLSSSGG